MTVSVRPLAVLVVAAVLAAAAPVRAQSLADVAKKEEERRQQVKEPAKVYTNKDLQPAPAPSTAQPAAPAGSAPQPADSSAAKDDSSKPAASTDGSGKSKSEGVKDQAYWTGRLKDLQSTLDRDQTYGEALQTRINALTTDFVNRDDPVQRAGIERERLKALAEFDRLKKQIVADKKAIDDFQEEGRRAGVPPGWLRF